MSLRKQDWGLIFLFALVRLVLSCKYSLGVDEAHYALYGLRPDLSYFDHPPLLGWIQALFLSVFGVHDWVVRLPAILAGVVSSVLVYKLSYRISRDQSAASAVVGALNLAFLPFGLFMMFLPDTLLLPLTLWLVFAVCNLIEEDTWKNWLILGLCLGLCGLSKYTAALYVLPLVLLAFREGVWKRWLSLKLVVAAILAFIVILPVLIWNHEHHWISFTYQTGHVVGGNLLDFKTFWTSLVAQFVAYSPFLVVMSLIGLRGWGKFNLPARVSLWICGSLFVFFVWSSFKTFVLPHWALVTYVLLFVVGISHGFVSDKFRRYLKIAQALSGVLILVILVELLFHVFPFKDYQTAYGDLTGWHELHDELQEYKKAHPGHEFSVGVANWTLGSRTVYYFSDVAQVFVLDDHFDQFDIWEAKQKPAQDFILMHWKGFDFPIPLEKMCTQSHVLSSHVFKQKNYIITSVDVILCEGFHQDIIKRWDDLVFSQ